MYIGTFSKLYGISIYNLEPRGLVSLFHALPRNSLERPRTPLRHFLFSETQASACLPAGRDWLGGFCIITHKNPIPSERQVKSAAGADGTG